MDSITTMDRDLRQKDAPLAYRTMDPKNRPEFP